MPKMSDERKQYLAQYQKEHLKRIPLDVSPDFYAIVKRAAGERGESVNGFIRIAIQHELMRPSKSPVNGS